MIIYEKSSTEKIMKDLLFLFLIVPLTFYTEVIKAKKKKEKKSRLVITKARVELGTGSGVNSGRGRSREPWFYHLQNRGGDFGLTVLLTAVIKRKENGVPGWLSRLGICL